MKSLQTGIQKNCTAIDLTAWVATLLRQLKRTAEAFRPKAQAMIVSQYNKILVRANFSPLK
jgi:hypothetical protein